MSMNAEEIKAGFEGLQKTWGEFKALHERLEAEVKKHGEATQETKTALKGANDRLDAIETAAKRLPTAPETEQKASKGKAAFLRWARKGMEALTPEETKALTLADDTQAGYLRLPPEFSNEIIKGITLISPMRSIARVRQMSAGSLRAPKRTAGLTGAWVVESGTRSASTGPTYGMEEITAHEMYGLVDVSQQLLEDEAFDLEAELNAEFVEAFAVLEGTAFVNGNAVGKPEGFSVNAACVASTYTAAAQDAFTTDDIIKALYELKDGYARNATWAFKRATISWIRQLKDATTGIYTWLPGLAMDKPPTILGQPYVEMPDLTAMAATTARGLVIGAVGDFRAGYSIADRVSIAVQRDPFTQATSGNVRFIARKRVGGQVMLAEAIKLITAHA